ncbi:biotin-dependent carboxyltransferase family protein [soil metagenome]
MSTVSPVSTVSSSWHVLEAGALVTLQDVGRAGLAHLGVPRAGWLDPAAATLANRLVGNREDAALLEVAGGGVRLQHRGDAGRWVAVTGAGCAVVVDGVARDHGHPTWLPVGGELRLGSALTGVRSYLAVAGGVEVTPVLGSRSTDTLAWVGPPQVRAGAVLPVGTVHGPPSPVDVTEQPHRAGRLRVSPGPRADWFGPDALAQLCVAEYAVTADSNRVGLRLSGPALTRVRTDELPSEGLVLGAVQVPPDGLPVVFLADHPTTGGYPVIAVVEAADLGRCAQLRPCDPVLFTAVSNA